MECKCYYDSLGFFRSSLTLSILFLQLFFTKKVPLVG